MGTLAVDYAQASARAPGRDHDPRELGIARASGWQVPAGPGAVPAQDQRLQMAGAPDAPTAQRP
jgi:hypothetical protein